MVSIGTFVTAKLVGKNDSRQGIYLGGTGDVSSIQGESGAIYICECEPAIVPDKDLRGSTLIFVTQWRTENLITDSLCDLKTKARSCRGRAITINRKEHQNIGA